MKRYILVCIIFISFAAMAQEKKVTWDYPVKPDMEEWKKCNSPEEIYFDATSLYQQAKSYITR
jgi:hypothetical protein